MPSSTHMLSPDPQELQNVTLFGDDLYRGYQIKMRSLGQTLIHSNWYIYRKEKFGHRHAFRENTL